MSSWSQEELSSIDLGDKRLNRRCQRLLGLLADSPGKSIPDACGSWADTMAAYRLFDNERVTMERILDSHLDSAVGRMKEEPIVLCIGDTTEIDFTSMKETEGLGPLSKEYVHGLMLHPIIAVTPGRINLGVLDACLWARDEKKFGKRRPKKKPPEEERESYRWIYGYNQVCKLAERVPNTRLVYVTDREGDMTTLLAEAQNGPVDILIRSARNRNLEDDDKLWEHMNSLPSQGEMTFEMPSGPGRSARTVIQQVRFDTITLKPAGANHAKLPEIIVTAVYAREENPPAGEDPIEWLLFTTKTVTTLEQAIVIISWYRCRWEIEVYFRTLKTGFRVERLQLETADRIKPAIALFMITTWRIVYLTKLGRVNPDVPATVAFTELECEVASRRTKRKEVKRLPTLREMIRMVAQMGGFLGRKSDGEPGPKSIWSGMEHLRHIIAAVPFLNFKVR